MSVKGSDVLYSVADAVAAHNLVHYTTRSDRHERLRLISGATLAALGFTLGPEMEDRLREISEGRLTRESQTQLVMAGGGLLLGGVLGYVFGPKLAGTNIVQPEGLEEIAREADIQRPGFRRSRPGTLLTFGSAGWLGYSLLHREQTEEMRDRQLWGLGAGVLGYCLGPWAIKQVKNLPFPAHAATEAGEIYSRGGALFGAIAGGAIGLHLGGRNNG